MSNGVMSMSSPILRQENGRPDTRETSSSAAKLSFVERKAPIERPATSHLVEGGNLLRNIDRPLPGDVVKHARRTQPREPVKSRSNYFEDVFSVKESNPARQRIQSDAIVLAEVKTNVLISDEFTFITELSMHLSTRYQRSVSSIVVTLHHGACMLFGGNFDPAYLMTVTALPCQLLATTNKRNAALIQKHMEEAIGVSPARGFLRFVPASPENIAVGGRTLAAEMDDLDRGPGLAADDAISHVSRRKSKSTKKLSSIRSFIPLSTVSMAAPKLTPPASSSDGTVPPMPKFAVVSSAPENGPIVALSQQRASRKKSFVETIFRGRSSKSEPRP